MTYMEVLPSLSYYVGNMIGGLDVEYLTCEVCKESLKDNKGDVMYPVSGPLDKIEKLQIWCANCSLNEANYRGYKRVFWDISKLNWSQEQWEEILNNETHTGNKSTSLRDKMLKIINREQ